MCGIRGRTWSAHYTELQRQPVRTVRTYGTIIGSRSMHDRILSCCLLGSVGYTDLQRQPIRTNVLTNLQRQPVRTYVR